VYKLGFYVPQGQVEEVKQACFAAGAGRIGRYENCCWQVLGQGQFRPLDGSRPAVGSIGKLETLAEYRVEMVCDEKVVDAVVAAMLAAHPYEEPAWDLVALARAST
jgi:hypothetical protein